jgi:DNA-binding FadR family transcriptional regulator
VQQVASVEQALRNLVANAVRDGMLGPGLKLPTERELVDQLAAPRSAVRHALAALERDGLITRHVGRGTFLAETAAGRLSVPPDSSPAEIMQVRLALEPQIAPLAAKAATQRDLELITHCLERGGSVSDFESFESWDVVLHRRIAEATHNGLLLSLFESMNAARELPVWGSLKRRSSTPERRRRYHDDHAAIVHALHDRDANVAGERMRDHLVRISQDLFEQ